MKRLNPQQQMRVLIAASLACWSLIVSFVYFAVPTSDDFATAIRLMDGVTVWDAVVRVYVGWTGRWSGVLLSSLIAECFDEMKYYQHLLFANALISLAGWICLVKAVWGKGLSWRTAAALGIFVHTLYLAGNPGLDETLYWLNGDIYYSLGAALSMMLLCAIRWSLSAGLSRNSAILVHGLLLICSVGPAGFNELLGVYWVMVMGAALLLSHLDRSASRPLLAAYFVVALIGMAIVAAAPGNAVRTEAYPRSLDLSIGMSLARTTQWRYLPAWTFDPRLILLTLFLFLAPPRLNPPRWLDQADKERLWLLGCIWGLGIMLGFLIPSIALGYLATRAMTVPYLWFMGGWLCFLAVFLKNEEHPASPFAFALRSWTLVLLVFAIMSTGNGRKALDELMSGSVQRQFELNNSRLQLVIDAAATGKQHVQVPVVPKISEMLRYPRSEYATDPTHKNNRNKARYYGLESVQMVEDFDGGPDHPRTDSPGVD